jgi:RHS repeat-associated protein
MTDAKGNLYQYFYNAAGLLIRDEYPAGGFKTLSRTNLPNGYEVTLATAEGQSSKYRVEKLSTGDMRYTTIDASGLATVTINKLDGTTITTTPDSTVTTRVLGPDPRLGMEAPLIKSLTVQTPGGLQSTLSQSRVITQMSGQTVTGQIDSVKINGRIYRTIYDGNLKQFTSISPEGRQTVTRVDNKGRMIEETVTGVSPITSTYDLQGRLIEILQGDRKSTFAYDALSRLSSATDPLIRTTTFAYDSVGRITQQVLPGAREILYAYDSNGNLTSLTPPSRPAHSFGYTAVDLTERYKPPLLNGDSTVTRYLYDLDRRIRNTIRPDSIAVSVFYDTVGCPTCGSAARPKTIIFDRGTLNFSYSPTTGLLTSLSAPGGNAITYTYDGTLPKKATWSGEVQGNVEVTYDNNFRVTSQKVNGGNSASFQYDNDGLLKTAGSLTITRDAQNGRITDTSLGSVTTSQTYNSFGELASFQAKFGSSALFETVYAQDSLGRIKELTETIQGQTRILKYAYDAAASRLASVSRNDTLVASYTYDANGNRLSHVTPSGTTTGTYDAQDRLLTYGNASYTYTRNGELMMKVVGTDTTRYTYDAFGNLVSVRLPNGTLIEYVIDGQNRRIGKKVNGRIVQKFLYLGQLNIVAELDSNNQITSRFIPGHMVKAGITYRVITDHLGSIRLVVNAATGEIVQRMDYNEFGNVLVDTNPGFQPLGYAGGMYDSQAGLVRFGTRDYDAETGRWTTKDPIGFEGGMNNYVYVANSPLVFTDPSGLYTQLDHSRNTFRIAVEMGFSIEAAWGFAIAAYDADVGTQSEYWYDTRVHSMSGRISEKGRYQTREEAIAARNEMVKQLAKEAREALAKGNCPGFYTAVGWALHALQDEFAAGHDFNEWRPKNPVALIPHLHLENFSPEAINATKNFLSQFRDR